MCNFRIRKLLMFARSSERNNEPKHEPRYAVRGPPQGEYPNGPAHQQQDAHLAVFAHGAQRALKSTTKYHGEYAEAQEALLYKNSPESVVGAEIPAAARLKASRAHAHQIITTEGAQAVLPYCFAAIQVTGAKALEHRGQAVP